jgi:hypothetical protein
MSVFEKLSDPVLNRYIVQATVYYSQRYFYCPDLIPCNATLVIETEGKQASMCCSMRGCQFCKRYLSPYRPVSERQRVLQSLLH